MNSSIVRDRNERDAMFYSVGICVGLGFFLSKLRFEAIQSICYGATTDLKGTRGDIYTQTKMEK